MSPVRTISGHSSRLYRPPWRIDITHRRGVPRLLPLAALARAVVAALAAAGAPAPAAAGVILTGDREITELNASAMGRREPTDVLAFPLLAPDAYPAHPGQRTGARGPSVAKVAFATPPGRRMDLGEVVVSVDRAVEQALTGRGGQTGDLSWSPADELRLLVTHGTLHLCGWDHADAEEEAAMRALEREVLIS